MNKNHLSKALCKEKGLDTSLFFEEFELMTAKEKKDIIARSYYSSKKPKLA
jgi:hypothetical protein